MFDRDLPLFDLVCHKVVFQLDVLSLAVAQHVTSLFKKDCVLVVLAGVCMCHCVPLLLNKVQHPQNCGYSVVDSGKIGLA